MGNKRKSGGGRKSRALRELLDRSPAPDYILERRQLFSFVQLPTEKKPEGRNGEIDSEVCDAIGQLHACGLLDAPGYDGRDLRDAGWFFANHFWNRYRETGPKTAKYERQDRSMSAYLGETAADRRFDRMDEALTGYERMCVVELVIDNHWDDGFAPWAQALIDEALRARGRHRRGEHQFVTMCQRARLAGCVRGLVAICGGMEMRRAA